MSQDRKRNIGKRKTKRIILVSFEGSNKTEKNYLNNFSKRDNDYIIKYVPGNETDPVSLVKQTIKKSNILELDLLEDDIAYCLFDTDIKVEKNMQIDAAIKLAEENNINPIVSSPCIELWFLLHYYYSTATVNNYEVIEKLRTYYPKYEKNCDIYPNIEDKLKTAITNSKKLEKYQLQNNKKLQKVEANPYTEMYKVIEEFIK